MQRQLLTAKNAQLLDELLFTKYSYSVTQLMELAGQAVALAFMEIQPVKNSKVLVMAGPGNNGGDGLVAARHLKCFGYNHTVSKAIPVPVPCTFVPVCNNFIHIFKIMM